MSKLQESRDHVIDHIAAYLKERMKAPKNHPIFLFSRIFYGTLAYEDLISRPVEELGDTLLTLWGYVSQQKAKMADIYLYNPDCSGQNSYTVIAICQRDMPFLVDSTIMEINRLGFSVRFVINTGHLYVQRDKSEKIVHMFEENTEGSCDAEAVIYLEIDYIEDPKTLNVIKENLTRVLSDVALAVNGWAGMLKKVESAMHDLTKASPHLEKNELDESLDFLKWLLNNNFTFLGCRDYRFSQTKKDAGTIDAVSGSGCGVLGEKSGSMLSKNLANLPARARDVLLSRQILVVAKTNTISTIHRPAYTDYIAIKQFDEKGHVIGFRLLIGLYTSAAYNSSPQHIPFLRNKISNILKLSKLSPVGHSGKALINILETLPRDDLFQATESELFDLSMGILHLKERQLTRLFLRKDTYNRYFSCLVYLPKDRIDTSLRQKMQAILLQELHGFESSFTTLLMTESILGRVHFVIRIDPTTPNEYDYKSIEKKLIAASHSWIDSFRDSLESKFGVAQGVQYFNQYRYVFGSGYREEYDANTAVIDLMHVERLSAQHQLELMFSSSAKDSQTIQLKLYRADSPSPLSDVLPILENMGFRVIGESPHALHFDHGKTVWVNDFQVVSSDGKGINIDDIQDVFQEAFPRVWFGEAENDRFNRLILTAQLSWKETALLRAYARYLKQIGFTFSQDYIADSLYHNPGLAKRLVELFLLRFSPETDSQKESLLTKCIKEINDALDAVVSLDEDKILRHLFSVVMATLRTNYFVRDKNQNPLSYISIKLNSALIPELPLPKPMFEVFVYSPRVEGIHLRGAKVARGGIRWSDRREDFRTEILGLMKAQQVKNSVIVPAGAKGGFVPKMLPTEGGRNAVLQEAISCYQIFIRGLLDITDNIVNAVVEPPANVVRYDQDDPYLVVAADKGTATFSDIANNLSQEYRFWLDDAFASGGSSGYDHKKMGITARGAWESAQRHFRELLKIDIQSTDFTVIGIGDMSGDVFGNGMLLSRHIKLVAAFNHLHIFVDPNPDPEKSFLERERLFQLPSSSWEDYDRSVLSSGAAIFRRNEKSLKLSKEIQQLLAVSVEEMSPNDLIKAIFKAKVDMFWNGGIGTFVKAASETDAFVGDRANDGIRVDAHELGCKVAVEGGNLGFTQKARIEFSQQGGCINTDFIDNSAGVDCSDHEVNLKILLNQMMANGDLTLKQRNKLLLDMTDEVAELVLRDNYLQTETLSLEVFSSDKTIDLLHGYLINLEKEGRINRKIEGLPTDQEILERKAAGIGFARPEIAVLLSYDKILLKEKILASDLPEDPYFFDMLAAAFPKRIAKKYEKELKQHSLRRELIATQLSSAVVNAMGINFVQRLINETGASVAFIIRAYIASQELFGLKGLWKKIRDLDSKVDTTVQFSMMLKLYFLARRSTRWFLRNRHDNIDIAECIKSFSTSLGLIKEKIPSFLTKEQKVHFRHRVQEYKDQGVPDGLAHDVALSAFLFNVLDIMQASKKLTYDVVDVAKAYFSVGVELSLDDLRDKMMTHPMNSAWDQVARAVLLDDIDYYQRVLVVTIFSDKNSHDGFEQAFEHWRKKEANLCHRWNELIIAVMANSEDGFIMFSVVLRELYELARIGNT